MSYFCQISHSDVLKIIACSIVHVCSNVHEIKKICFFCRVTINTAVGRRERECKSGLLSCSFKGLM